MMDKHLFNKIIEAAEKDSDDLDGLLRIAIEQEDGYEVDRLLDKVHQIITEQYRDAVNWHYRSIHSRYRKLEER